MTNLAKEHAVTVDYSTSQKVLSLETRDLGICPGSARQAAKDITDMFFLGKSGGFW